MIGRLIQRMRLLGAQGSDSKPGQTYREWWNASSPTMEAAYAATIAPMTESEYRSRGWNGDVNSFGARQLLERGKLGPGSRVLEIGCGIARLGREMAPRVKEWHGADISPNMLALARERTAHLPNVVFHELKDESALAALPAASYDFVYSTIVLMHLDMEDLFEYLLQSHRLLADGGGAYFDTWNILHPDTFRMWREASRHWLGSDKPRGRYQCSTPDEFRLYLEEAGFAVESLDTQERLIRAFCRKVPGGPPPLEDDGWAPFGYVSGPWNDTEVSGRITVEGWCLDRVRKVEVRLGTLPPVEARIGTPRPDIPPLFSRYPEGANSGFLCEIDTAALPDGEHELIATAIDDAGRQTPLSGEYWGLRVKNH